MKCTACGTEISEKALVCFRCGAPTEDCRPAAAPPRPRRRAEAMLSLAAFVLLIVAALYMGQAASGQVPRAVVWLVAGLAVVAVASWFVARRRR